jgi:hypothetical protein
MTHTVMYMPQARLELLLVVLAVVFAVASHAALQRIFRTEMLRQHNDVAGFLFSAIGVLYAVVLGFVVVVVWEKYDSTVANVDAEASAASDLYHAVDGYPEPVRHQIRRDLSRYAAAVIRVEWPAMMRDMPVPDDASRLLEDADYRIATFSPKTPEESDAQQVAMAEILRVFDARRERLIKAAPLVPGVLWFALVAGAMAMIAFAYLFGVENQHTQLMMTAILVGLIAILFVVIHAFAHPFSGSVRISDEGWTHFIMHQPEIR